MDFEGERGFWVPRDVFLELEVEDDEAPRLRDELREAEAELLALRKSARLYAFTGSIAEGALEVCRRVRDQAIEDRSMDLRAFRSAVEAGGGSWGERIAWVIAGVLGGGAVGLTGGYAAGLGACE